MSYACIHEYIAHFVSSNYFTRDLDGKCYEGTVKRRYVVYYSMPTYIHT